MTRRSTTKPRTRGMPQQRKAAAMGKARAYANGIASDEYGNGRAYYGFLAGALWAYRAAQSDARPVKERGRP